MCLFGGAQRKRKSAAAARAKAVAAAMAASPLARPLTPPSRVANAAPAISRADDDDVDDDATTPAPCRVVAHPGGALASSPSLDGVVAYPAGALVALCVPARNELLAALRAPTPSEASDRDVVVVNVRDDENANAAMRRRSSLGRRGGSQRAPPASFHRATFSRPNGVYVAAGERDASDPAVCVWDASRARPLAVLRGGHRASRKTSSDGTEKLDSDATTTIADVAFSPADARWVVSVGGGALCVWDWRAGALLARERVDASATAVSVGCDGREIIVAGAGAGGVGVATFRVRKTTTTTTTTAAAEAEASRARVVAK